MLLMFSFVWEIHQDLVSGPWKNLMIMERPGHLGNLCMSFFNVQEFNQISSRQHFSDSVADCEIHFGKDSLKPITKDDDVICTTEYSKIVPLENGEVSFHLTITLRSCFLNILLIILLNYHKKIPVMLLNNRPSANNYFNSTLLQEWTRATNVRVRLLRTKNLLGHLMSVARQDPTVTRRVRSFYSL